MLRLPQALGLHRENACVCPTGVEATFLLFQLIQRTPQIRQELVISLSYKFSIFTVVVATVILANCEFMYFVGCAKPKEKNKTKLNNNNNIGVIFYCMKRV